MSQDPNFQVFASFADSAFRAQALALKGLEQIADLQFGALERQAKAAADLAAGALQVRDADALRALWDKGANFGREGAERGVALTQDIFALAQKTAESISAIVNGQWAANDATAAPVGRAKKAAS